MASAAGLLAGRLALVTGAGSGIGKAVCQVFAKEGATVAVVDLHADTANSTLETLPKGDHQAFGADVSCSASVNDLIGQLKDKFSAVPTVTVNSAGITRDKLMLKMSEEDFDEVIGVNLKGTYLVNQAVSRALVESKAKGGSIINISSISGKVGNVGQTNYAASKAGVVGLTKTVAKEMGRFGIRVNAILPGFIETPMTDKVPDHLIQMTKMLIPLSRLGKPEEIANACLFLASDHSSYVTGTTLEVAGGLFP
uniref:(3R)-3-hydroxyacyl-CoA dehydrogenase n=1 Tax=Azumapecten farreri TaxID=106299 RepID=W0C627_AZUFA|nr:17beta-hydroxysteroid dehydrogenase 8 [Azumapecten farreri]